MEKQYLLSVDQSTQGTKALLFDQEGNLICRGDRPHRQIINDAGWVSHDLNEIYSNTLKVVRDVIEKAGIRREQVAGLGISNQRETSAVWDRTDAVSYTHLDVYKRQQYSTLEARGFGVAIIYQELSLMSEMNVMENVYVSHEPRKVGNLIDFRKMYADTKEQLAKLNAGHIDPRGRVGDLSLPEKQMVEIAKACLLYTSRCV